MNREHFQVVRSGKDCWMVWRISDTFDTPNGTGRYHEQVARVIEDGGLYFVEEPVWANDELDSWSRKPRGWMTKDGAVHSVTHPKKALAS